MFAEPETLHHLLPDPPRTLAVLGCLSRTPGLCESSPTWRRAANQRGASVVMATVASKLRRSRVSCKLGYYCFSDTPYSRASTHTHTHIHTRSSAPANTHIHTCSSAPANTYIHTRSSAPAPSAGTMDDSKEEYEAAFRSLLRKLTLSSRESTPPPGSP